MAESKVSSSCFGKELLRKGDRRRETGDGQ